MQTLAQQIGKQPMIAVPLPVVIQWCQEEICCFQRPEVL
jgi:hypothetical protein